MGCSGLLLIRRHGQDAKEVHEKWQGHWSKVVEDYLETTPWLRAAIYVHEISKDVGLHKLGGDVSS